MAAIRNFRFVANIGTTRAGGGNIEAQAGRAMKGIVSNWQEFVDQVEELVPEVLLNAMHIPFEKSQAYCPVKTGEMKASGYLVITRRGQKPQVEIGYGRGNSPSYTALQHENLEFGHKPPTRAKWLQSALEESASVVQQQVVQGLKNFQRGIFKAREMVRGSSNVRLR